MIERRPSITEPISVCALFFREDASAWHSMLEDSLSISEGNGFLQPFWNDPATHVPTWLEGAGHVTDTLHDAPLAQVYRGWNVAVEDARNEWVCLVNSDMVFGVGWLDALVREKRLHPEHIPTSLLVESGRIKSAYPEWVRNFGLTPKEINSSSFMEHAEDLRMRAWEGDRVEAGRLYMPVLLHKEEWFDAGKYPEGNVVIGGKQVPGDRIFFDRLKSLGYTHVMVKDSIVYHVQEGEKRDEP